MPIPDYQTTMLPLLELLTDKEEHPIGEITEKLADHFNLTLEERKELLPSGRQAVLRNRVGWARTYMKKAGLCEYPRRGAVMITDRGLEVIAAKPDRIDVQYLMRFTEFVEFRNLRHPKDNSKTVVERAIGEKTPMEVMVAAYEELQDAIEDEVLQHVKAQSPSFFEELVVDLLVAMGYGGNRKEAGQAVGRSGDGGIDGIIQEDRLALDSIYVQAKRWEGTVGRPEIQKFVGALRGEGARKGVFITTSDFSREAREYAERVDISVALISGAELAQLMVEHDLGVSVEEVFAVKRIDISYFEED